MSCIDETDEAKVELLRNDFEDVLAGELEKIESAGLCVGCAIQFALTCLAESVVRHVDPPEEEVDDTMAMIMGVMRTAIDRVTLNNVKQAKTPKQFSMAIIDMMEAQSMSAEEAIALMSRRAEAAEQLVLDMRGNMVNEMEASYRRGYAEGRGMKKPH